MHRINIAEEDIQTYALINNKINCATKALNIKIIPDDASDEKVHKYLNNVLGILSGYKYLREDWFRQIKKKYNIPDEQMIQYRAWSPYVEYVDSFEGGCCDDAST